MRRIIIILNGEGLQAERITNLLQKEDIIIAADGGANYCLELGIRPHYIIGDLDSIRVGHESLLPESELIRIDDQYSTDLEKALKLAETLHSERWIVLNATGKRSDHALANILFLSRISQKIDLQVIDNYGRMRFLSPGKHSFRWPRGTIFSLIAWQAVKNLSIEGAQYPLDHADFDPFFVGISNVAIASVCTISFDAGLLSLYEVERGV